MRYIRKIPPADRAVCDGLVRDGWKRLKEPASLSAAILCSLPFAIVAFAAELVLIYYLYAPFRALLDGGTFLFEIKLNSMTLAYVALTVIFMLLHEAVHACFIPGFMRSQKTYWGFNGIVGFVYTEEKIKKKTFLLISAAPYLLLSFVLPVALGVLGLLNGFICFLCVLNACGSCVDLLNIVLVAKQVPKYAYIVSSGFETYFKMS